MINPLDPNELRLEQRSTSTSSLFLNWETEGRKKEQIVPAREREGEKRKKSNSFVYTFLFSHSPGCLVKEDEREITSNVEMSTNSVKVYFVMRDFNEQIMSRMEFLSPSLLIDAVQWDSIESIRCSATTTTTSLHPTIRINDRWPTSVNAHQLLWCLSFSFVS